MKRLLAARPLAALAVGGVVAFSAASALAADGEIYFMTQIGDYDRQLILAASDRGVVLIDGENQVFRAFSHDQNAPDGVEQPFLWVDDIDSDDNLEIVAAGDPSFVIESNGDPLWGVLTGCDQFFVGDFIDSDNQEIFCIADQDVNVWSYDGQDYYSWSGGGYSMTQCYADDYDSDRELEVACGLTNGNHLSFDLEFVEPEEVEYEAQSAPPGGVDASECQAAVAGTQGLDVGTGADVTLSFAGSALTLTGGASGTVPVGGANCAISADLDGDGTGNIYVGGTDEVYVISSMGELVATIPANPASMGREARVEIRSATANGLEDSDRDSIRALLDAQMDSLVGCYDDSMGNNQFTRVGNMLWELTVDDDGDVSDATKRHSSLRDTGLESCIEDTLSGIGFSPATEGSGLVSINLAFDFVSTP